MDQDKKEASVLIVDDSPENIKILVEILKDDFKILAATSGEKGCDLAFSAVRKPDIILLDIMMPDIDGYEVCRRLKADPSTRNIPVIFVTAVSEVMDATKGFSLGAVDYIPKPFYPPVVKARVRTHMTLIRQRRELEKANATKDKLFSTIAHDMRNKFSALLSSVELMSDYFDTMDRKEQQDVVQSISHSTTHMYTLFENLFNWAKTQTNRIDICPSRVNLLNAVERVSTLYQEDARVKQVALTTDVHPESAVTCDENMLMFIIRNVVHNAIKYCSGGQEIQISDEMENGYCRLIVRDNGCGMSPEICAHLFDIRNSASMPGTGDETGSGLGLILVKEFVELNLGRVAVSSRENEGTEVVVSLPCHEEPVDSPGN
ncbi:MAG: hybrid sensor histidine kinase/response regulator [Desulfobacterales bacterium]|nr:hybrid sensor histidine kinase/response regulator [Desulfobacterales bacterium]